MGFFSVPPVNFRNRESVTASELALTLESLTSQLNNFASALKLKKLADGVQLEAKIITRPGSVLSAGDISGRIIADQLITAGQSFVTNFSAGGLVFSATDHNTVAWTAGILKLQDGRIFNIGSGNTGNMTAFTYIYFDEGASRTALQTTTDKDDVSGDGKILLCVAQNIADTSQKAFYIPAVGTVGLNENNIQANSISAATIQAGAVTAAKISVSQLSAIAADMGTLTAGTITLSDANSYIRLGTTPPTSATVGTGLWIDRTGLYGLNSNVQKFILSASTGNITAVGTIRTATTGNRIELGTAGDNIVKFYNSFGDVVTFTQVDVASGYLEISGLVRFATTIDQCGTTTLVTNLNADMVDGKNIRQANGASVTAGTNNITFSSTIGTTNYSLFVRIFNANNEQLGFKVTTKSATGFTVEDVYESGTLEYIAVG